MVEDERKYRLDKEGGDTNAQLNCCEFLWCEKGSFEEQPLAVGAPMHFLMIHCSGPGRLKCNHPASANGSPGSKCSPLLATGRVRAQRPNPRGSLRVLMGVTQPPDSLPRAFWRELTWTGLQEMKAQSPVQFCFYWNQWGNFHSWQWSQDCVLCLPSVRLLHPFPGSSGRCLALLASTPKTKTHFGLPDWKSTHCWLLSWFCFLQKMNKLVKSLYSEIFCSNFTNIWKKTQMCL